MSVLSSQRTESKIEYVRIARELFTFTLSFLARLSARYSRLLADDTIRLASEIVDYAIMANDAYPSDETRKKLREEYALRARAATTALDNRLAKVYEILKLNPGACFVKADGSPLKSEDAKKKLNSEAWHLGRLIDTEINLLTGLIKSI